MIQDYQLSSPRTIFNITEHTLCMGGTGLEFLFYFADLQELYSGLDSLVHSAWFPLSWESIER